MAYDESRGWRRGARLVVLDGPSGTGKSTVSRRLARALGAGYLDTGALYRMVTLNVLDRGIDPADSDAVAESLATLHFDTPTDPDDQRQVLAGVDVTARIRQADVTAAVSAVSAIPAVREFLLQRQRDLAYARPMVVEGRDIGTVVAPDAAVKIFLTADAAVRASRRLQQNSVSNADGSGADGPGTIEAVQQDLARRDTADSTRTLAPLEAAADAVLVDSTDQSIEETTKLVLAIAAERGVMPPVSQPVTWSRLGGSTDPVPEGCKPRNVDRGRRIGIALSHLMYRMKVRGEAHIPPSGPLVVVANHTTFADGPILFGRLPRRVAFLVKAEVLVGPLGWLLRTVGQYSIDRAAPQRDVLMAALAHLRSGGVLGVFPEGQRTDGSVTDVFNGAGWLAARAGAAVVPVALRGTAKPSGRRLKRFRPKVYALVGESFAIPPGAGRAAITAATQQIQQRLSALVADLDRGLARAADDRARFGPGWRRA